MIAITAKEKETITRLYPKVQIVRTMKQRSKRHRYYCEETRAVVRQLKRMREGSVLESY